jgi:acyl-CoA thioester hydrolase
MASGEVDPVMKDFVLKVPLRWGDMDAMAHLNNVMYFRLMEEARIQWFQQFALPTLPTGEACILAHASCDFVRAMTYPGVALVRQVVTRVGRSSVEMAITIEKEGEPGVAYATGRTVLVWYDYRQGKSLPWPEHVRSTIT